jgi:serine/threonine protein kinase
MYMDRDDPLVRIISDLRQRYSQCCTISSFENWWAFNPLSSREYPRQGWKLHVSALPAYAEQVLQAVAEILIEQATRWKVCQDLKHLLELLSVPSAYTQVGKFITVYPRTQEQAVQLAGLLHRVTAAYPGPVIPTDKRYAPGSQVYYRYGSFTQLEFYHPDTSLKTPYILDPHGAKVHDQRVPGQYCPGWIADPFPGTARRAASGTGGGLFGKNLTVRNMLRRSAKGGIYVVQTDSGLAVLKEARLGTNPDLAGRDARDRLANEFEILRQLAPLGIAPQPLELFDAEENRYVLMEYLDGQSLATYIEQRNYLGDDECDHLRGICTSLIHLVHTCHAAGVVIRDFTPNNVMVREQTCKLIDLELAALRKNEQAPFTGYTPGYVVPGTELLARETVQDDLYALGAMLCFILTGISPHLFSLERAQDTPEETLFPLLRAGALRDLLSFAIQCLRAADASAEARALMPARLESAGTHQGIPAPPGSPEPPGGLRNEEDLPFDWEMLKANAAGVARHLHQTAAWQSTGTLWKQSIVGKLLHPASFHTGTAGLAYYLCEVAQATGDTTYYAYAAEIMDWTLSRHPFSPEESPAGLYFGYAAVPWVLAMLADGLHDPRYADQALSLARQISRAPLRQLDITHGAAGRGLMHLALYRRLGDQQQLGYAIELARLISEQPEKHADGTITWLNQGKRLWGFAHGVAGMAYSVLQVFAHTGHPQFRAVAEQAASTLQRVALPAAHGQGLTWAMGPADTTTRWTHWCNGASGVGLYFLAAAKVLHIPEFERTAVLAARTIHLGNAFGSCCQCHGLAGEGDYLLQVSRMLGRPEMEQAARKTARKLFALRSTQDQHWLWPEETRSHPAPDYMTGYCGVYSFLLRLLRPDLPRPFLQSQARALPEQRLLPEEETPYAYH